MAQLWGLRVLGTVAFYLRGRLMGTGSLPPFPASCAPHFKGGGGKEKELKPHTALDRDSARNSTRPHLKKGRFVTFTNKAVSGPVRYCVGRQARKRRAPRL